MIRGWCGALIEALREPATPVGRFWLAWTLHSLLTPEADTISEDADAWGEALRGQQGVGLAFAVAAVVVAAPVAEELLFRRLWFPALRQRYGVAVGIAASACLFAAMHGEAQAFVPLATLGAGFAWLYHRTRSLVGCTVAHALNNALAVATTALWG